MQQQAYRRRKKKRKNRNKVIAARLIFAAVIILAVVLLIFGGYKLYGVISDAMNDDVSVTTVTVTGKGNYSGSKSLDFYILKDVR